MQEDTMIAESLAKGRKGRKKQKVEGAKVVAPQVQKALGTDPLSPQAQTEGTVLLVLLALFSLIILEGLLLALSGFLPESVDQFATDYIYKSFSPTVGVFVLCSTVYGVWKSKAQ
eukprot:jgi/Astpho2/5672/Aster-x1311